MSLTTRSLVKTHLGIAAGDTSVDAQLDQWIAQASRAVRTYLGQYVGAMLSSVSVASPGVITCPGHGLATGDVIVVAHSTTTPSLDGTQTVTRLSDDTFHVGVNVSSAGTAGTGTFTRQYTEFCEGTGGRTFGVRERPVQEIVSLWLDDGAAYGEADGAFAAETLLVAGTDYNLVRDGSFAESGKSGLVVRVGGVWPRPGERRGAALSNFAGRANGNLKVTYVAGYVAIPPDLALAVHQLVAQIRRASALGIAPASESYDYYRYTLAPRGGTDDLGQVRQLLARYRPLVW